MAKFDVLYRVDPEILGEIEHNPHPNPYWRYTRAIVTENWLKTVLNCNWFKLIFIEAVRPEVVDVYCPHCARAKSCLVAYYPKCDGVPRIPITVCEPCWDRIDRKRR